GGLAALQEYVFSEFSRLHVRYKTAAWLRGFIPSPAMRPPMPRPRRAEIDALARQRVDLGPAGPGHRRTHGRAGDEPAQPGRGLVPHVQAGELGEDVFLQRGQPA